MLVSQCKESSGPSVRSLMTYKEMMRQWVVGQCSEFTLSSLALLVR